VKALFALLVSLVVVTLAAGPALAFSCPTLVKEANDAIAKAEPMAGKGDDRQKARNQGMIDEAKELAKEADAAHKGGAHGRAEAKAKAAKFLAEQVK
jgi:hypothetical protein